MKYVSCLLFILAAMVAAPAAHSRCLMPHGAPDAEMGVIVFNKDHKVMQYCNGDDWIGLWGGGGGGGAQRISGEIAAFALSTCPDGWSEYAPARGRFLRGIDPNGTNDVVRVAGDTQVDDLKSHLHSVDPPSTATSSAGAHTHTVAKGTSGGWGGNNSNTRLQVSWNTDNVGTVPTSSAGNHTHTINIAAFNSALTGGSETRPKNVAVLYCIKS